MDVTVVVPSTDGAWARLAETRAIPSARALGLPVVHGRGPTLQQARNNGLAQVDTPWVVHLDADDELETGYVEAMAGGTADVRAPSVRYVYRPGTAAAPGMPQVSGHTHLCEAACLAYGNWLVIGSAARTDLVRAVGGWHDYPVYEDFDLWARCWLAGATIEAVPAAIYRAWVNPRSRNRGTPPALRHATHQAIARANGLPVP